MQRFIITGAAPSHGLSEEYHYFLVKCDEPVDNEDELLNGSDFKFIHKERIVQTFKLSDYEYLLAVEKTS